MESTSLEHPNTTNDTSSSSTDFPRANRPAVSLAVTGGTDSAASLSVGRPFEHRGFDEFAHQLKRHRSDLQAIDAQMQKLDESIEGDQRRIQDFRLGLEEKFRARARVQVVRQAMARFVDGLQAKDGK